jgi:16S rRNA (guanine(527)-N(7))-methyltransferase RsmG
VQHLYTKIALPVIQLAISFVTAMKNKRQNSQNASADFKVELEKALIDFQIPALSEVQKERLCRHYEMLLNWNRHTNLTRIVSPAEAARLHYAESVFSAQFIADAKTSLDIGSGAGFPAVPLASVRDDLEVTALEVNQKKALFLQEVKDALQLQNFHVARQRVEDFDLASFDVLISRALDNAEAMMQNILLRLSDNQRLLLYGARAMLERLYTPASNRYQIDYHKIPLSESRFLALFSAK